MRTNMEENGDAASRQRRPWFKIKDLGEILVLIFFTPIAWIMPPRFWRTFTYPTALVLGFTGILSTRKKISNIRKICGDHFDDPKPYAIEKNRAANIIEQKVQYLREYSSKGWKPVINVRGIETIEDALDNGKGAVLWVAPFFFNNLVVKKGLYRANYPISHLSAYNHGPSLSRFGIRFVNKVYIKAENKYLDERIIIQPARDLRYKNAGTNLAYIKELEIILKANGLVTVSCQPDPALEHQGVAKRIMNGNLLLATGAPSLALANGSALIPVFTVRKTSDEFEVILEKPLSVPDEGNRQEKIKHLLDEFVELTEAYAVKYPVLFKPWHELTVD